MFNNFFFDVRKVESFIRRVGKMAIIVHVKIISKERSNYLKAQRNT